MGGDEFYFEPDVTFKYKEIWVCFMVKIGQIFLIFRFPFTSTKTSILWKCVLVLVTVFTKGRTDYNYKHAFGAVLSVLSFLITWNI